MKLSKLLESVVAGTDLGDLDITNATVDSRKVAPGTLFIACKGATATSPDGHIFLLEAQQKGAKAVIVDANTSGLPKLTIPVLAVSNSSRVAAVLLERFNGSPSAQLKIAGVTGTNGKSSVTFLLSGILNSAGFNSAVIGTLGAGPLNDLKSTGLTTPGAELLSRLLKGFVEQRFTHVCMEASSHALHGHRLDGLHFDTAAFTNLSEDHLDFHGDMKSYRQSKERLFLELLAPGKNAVLPYNDPLVSVLKRSHNVIEWLPYQRGDSAPKDNLVSAQLHSMSAEGTHLTLSVCGQTAEFRTPLFGTFHIDNLLVAAALAYAQGLSIDKIAQGFSKPPGIPGRLERIYCGDFQKGPSVFVDFAHTPDGLLRALQALRPLTRGRLIVVFGCGGNRDKPKRPLMGAIAAAHADLVFVTSDNPRFEDPELIIAEIVAGIRNTDLVQRVADRRLAIKQAIGAAEAGDIVLVAGKGHELTLDIGNRKIPFYDPDVVREILKEYGECTHSHLL